MTPAGPAQLLIVALVVIVLFGSNRLPDVARSVGRSMRIFKSEIKEMNKDQIESSDQTLKN
ncbi:Sec-independent protein translocase subunit TatA [Corynebacterium glutamicum]|jgi:sec-independent protein translocase protein TatA|uniref:Sec-independent protein translocase subunit TatA n=1 Tax=Corynebacterium glutamicum TaxID=1718 RepID=UPI000744C301|nr:Sec-independent protein translocase subunit TatA [Corynebacterium glutamicum]AMA01417.1 preprotein translocase subunit TatA [Corynebacterium glutamicum]QDQ19577.1 Sec-independent protein translocase subunit TatA [Corynebacterium glutamicum]QDQ23142.1 Sec-independent protein translocase subunit TatA [Corynebacterium glutamicum]GFK20330.1 Sec-independent protein translocase protein TatA [Corynebacterium glutamicum]